MGFETVHQKKELIQDQLNRKIYQLDLGLVFGTHCPENGAYSIQSDIHQNDSGTRARMCKRRQVQLQVEGENC